MIDLQKEAEEYAKHEAIQWYINDSGKKVYEDYTLSVALMDFTKTSKYVQAEKLRAQIEIAEWIAIGGIDPTKVLNRLQEQLKTLENDTNRNE